MRFWDNQDFPRSSVQIFDKQEAPKSSLFISCSHSFAVKFSTSSNLVLGTFKPFRMQGFQVFWNFLAYLSRRLKNTKFRNISDFYKKQKKATFLSTWSKHKLICISFKAYILSICKNLSTWKNIWRIPKIGPNEHQKTIICCNDFLLKFQIFGI